MLLYECKKLLKNASVIKVIAALLILSSIIFYGELNLDKDAHQTYLSFHKVTDSMSNEDTEKWLNDNKGNDTGGYGSYKALSYLEEEISALNEYDKYRESVQNRYYESMSISIFAKEDINRYMEKIANRYSDLDIDKPMKLQPYQGIRKVLESYSRYLFVIVLLIYLVSVVYIQEQKNGKSDFASTMLRGRKPVFLAKFFAVYGTSVIYLFVTYVIQILLTAGIYGKISVHAAIQSIPGFYAVPYGWSIMEYLLIYFLLQSIALLILVGLAVLIGRLTSSEFKTAVGIVIVMALNITAYRLFSGDGIEAVLRTWNIWSILLGKSFIDNYEIIRFGNIFIEENLGIPLFIILSIVLLVIGSVISPKISNSIYKTKDKNMIRPHGLFFYEMKKIWIYQGALFLLILSTVIQGAVIYQHNSYLGTDEFYYNKYIDKIGDVVTADTDKKIVAEQKRLDHLEEEFYNAKDSIHSYKLSHELECVGGFLKYKDRVEGLKESGKEPILLKDMQYKLLFGDTEVSKLMIILLCISIAFIIPEVYNKEKETGMNIMQNTAVYGGKTLDRIKIILVILYSFVFQLVSSIIIFIKQIAAYNLQWDAPVTCLMQYWNTQLKISVGSFWIIGIIIQFVRSSLLIIAISVIAKRIKNYNMLTALILGITVIPTILSSYIPMPVLSVVHDYLFVFTGRIKSQFIISLVLVVIIFLMTREKKR